MESTNSSVSVDFRWYEAAGLHQALLTVSALSGVPFVDALEAAAVLSKTPGIEKGLMWRGSKPSNLAVVVAIGAVGPSEDFEGSQNDVIPTIFLGTDITIGEVEAMLHDDGYTQPPVLIVSPNDGVGGDSEVLEFFTDSLQTLRAISEIAGYLSAFMVVVKSIRRRRDRPAAFEVEVSYLTEKVTPELIRILREQPEWTADAVSDRFGLTPPSAAKLMPACGFTPLIDGTRIVWLRDDGFEIAPA